MSRFQPIYDIAELCARKGVNHAVLCPGSRCAPLTIAFARNPQIETKTFSDERSAAFVAMGIAQRTKAPCILLCTSGSAAYNFAPAVAEAFFSQTPLLVFTADRPTEWIGQHDGQTIYQQEIFGKHVKRSFELPSDYHHPDASWMINRIINEAINLSVTAPAGPVHINAPFREPLYPKSSNEVSFSDTIRTIDAYGASYSLNEEQREFIKSNFGKFNNILVVAGQEERNLEKEEALQSLIDHHDLPVIGDIISNLHAIPKVIRHADAFLPQASDEIKTSLQPDLLITFGKSVISKHLKLFLRRYKPVEHWHFQEDEMVVDTYQSITHIFQVSATSAFQFLDSVERTSGFESQKQKNYYNLWENEERRTARALKEFFPVPEMGELEIVKDVLRHLPEKANLHLANSMSVRYANLVGLDAKLKDIEVFANRGTSGIDGCTSTVVGHCLDNAVPNILIIGDVAFFYDRNAFWHNYSLPNLRVVLLNNHGGVIFGIIDGPASLPEADEYFITRQRLNAKSLCEEFGFDHLKLDSKRKMKNLLHDFFDLDGRTKVLEIESDAVINRTIFENLKLKIKKNYES